MCEKFSMRDNTCILQNNGVRLKSDMTLHFLLKYSSRLLQTPYPMNLFGLNKNLIGPRKIKNTDKRED